MALPRILFGQMKYSTNTSSKYVKVVEVGARDGLQNEKAVITLADRITLINKLTEAGLPVIEAGAFVSSKWVPQVKFNYNLRFYRL